MSSSLVSRLAVWRARRRFAEVGARLRVDGPLRIPAMRGRVVLGADVVVQCEPFATELKAGHPQARLDVGDGVRIGYGCMILAERTSVAIGANAVVGPMARIVDTDYHDADSMGWDRAPRRIRIGAGVILGPWVIVTKGSEIGDGAVVHAGSVVSGKIRAGAVVGGNPARAASSAVGLEHVEDPLERLCRFLMMELELPTLPRPDENVPRLGALDSLGRVMFRVALEDTLGFRIALGTSFRSLTPAALLAQNS